MENQYTVQQCTCKDIFHINTVKKQCRNQSVSDLDNGSAELNVVGSGTFPSPTKMVLRHQCPYQILTGFFNSVGGWVQCPSFLSTFSSYVSTCTSCPSSLSYPFQEQDNPPPTLIKFRVTVQIRFSGNVHTSSRIVQTKISPRSSGLCQKCKEIIRL